MKVPGFLLFFLFSLFVLLHAENNETVLPSVFDDAIPDYNCTAMINDINVSYAIAVTEMKFRLQASKGWLESGMGYIDTFHAEVTQTVHVFSANADRQLARWSGDKNITESKRKVPRDGNITESMSDYFNRLFHDNTYLYSTESSYLILRLGVEVNKELGPQFLNEVKFAISLPHTEKQLQIFVGDPLADQNKQVIDEDGKVNSTTAVGARYFVPEYIKNLKTDLSAGFRGIGNPFVQARFEYPINFYDWLVRPVQYFELSVKNEYYEETDLYFDRRISKKEMVRLQLQRSTETQTEGMQYTASLSYFNTLRFNTGFRMLAGLAGDTVLDPNRYENPRYGDVNPHTGVYRYTISGGWKASFLRKWLFYEIDPRVDFDMLYNWRPNYVTQFWIEFYFGDD